MYDNGNSQDPGNQRGPRTSTLQGIAMRPEAPQIGPSRDPNPTPARLVVEEDICHLWPVARPSSPDLEEDAGLPKVPRDYRRAISDKCDELKAFLLAKNKAYGNSVFLPENIFGNTSARDGVIVRVNDKLKRIKAKETFPGDDNVKDLVGYLICLLVIDDE